MFGISIFDSVKHPIKRKGYGGQCAWVHGLKLQLTRINLFIFQCYSWWVIFWRVLLGNVTLRGNFFGGSFFGNSKGERHWNTRPLVHPAFKQIVLVNVWLINLGLTKNPGWDQNWQAMVWSHGKVKTFGWIQQMFFLAESFFSTSPHAWPDGHTSSHTGHMVLPQELA